MRAGRITNAAYPVSCDNYNLADLLKSLSSDAQCDRIATLGVERFATRRPGDLQIKHDVFPGARVSCSFVRFGPSHLRDIRVTASGSCSLTTCASGGWLLAPLEKERDTYWLPLAPRLRKLDAFGHVLEEHDVEFSDISIGSHELTFQVKIPDGWSLDWDIWQLDPSAGTLNVELQQLHPVETHGYFLWGSHTLYRRPSDVYHHLIHGHVYENRFSWPKYWKICSENDAHALCTVLHGLGLATGKQLYHLLRAQLLLSVISRQGEDGGWRHGEWSDGMESHYRLHCSGMHMLIDALEERNDPVVQESLRKAAAFIAKQHDPMSVGAWFLHDDLEHSAEGMNQAPFRWYPGLVLGKSASNMLVLNTQLDTTIALHRYGELANGGEYASLLASACKATDAVLGLKSAELLYRALFWAIDLTLLPTRVAKDLPLPLRALKRLARKYLIPLLPRIRTAWPRLVTPGGYIERALSVGTLSDAYLSINLMDLARYLRRFGGENIEALIAGAVKFARDKGLLEHWRENTSNVYALGFWAEAMYHLCTINRLPEYRSMLAETMLALDAQGIGVPPSLLGANSEAVAHADQVACPLASDPRLRVANLNHRNAREILVVNPTVGTIKLTWLQGGDSLNALAWTSADGRVQTSPELSVPGRGFLFGTAKTA